MWNTWNVWEKTTTGQWMRESSSMKKMEMDQNSRQHTPQDLPSKQTITVIPCGCVDIFWGHHVWPIPKHCQMKGFVWKYFASIIRWWWFVFMFAIENASNCYIPVIYPPFSHTHTQKASWANARWRLSSEPARGSGWWACTDLASRLCLSLLVTVSRCANKMLGSRWAKGRNKWGG